MAKPIQNVLAKKLAAGEVSNEFFQAFETEVIPEARFRELVSELLTHWETVGKMYSVPWIWVMSCELSLAGMLAPTAALYPIESITIYLLTWVFILHPGSTQTSGLGRLYQDVLDEIEIEMNRLRKTMFLIGPDYIRRQVLE